MSIITIRCRLVASIKQKIDCNSIKNFTGVEQDLLQQLLDEQVRVELNKIAKENVKIDAKIEKKIKKQTYVWLAESSEDARRQLWHFFLIGSSLIDELLDRLSQHRNFETWRQQGKLPDDELKACWLDLKNSPLYDNRLPGRFFSSVQSMVRNIYASWLALNEAKQQELNGLKRLLEIVYSDEDLLKICDCQFEQLQAEAASILTKIDRELANADPPPSRIRLLFQKYPELPEEDILSRAAIAYLIRHGCQLKSEIEPAAKFSKWFKIKRKRARRLETQLAAAHFPRGRDIQDKALTSCLETTNRDDFSDELEYGLWCDALDRNSSSLPHPIEFDSNTDLRWLKIYRRQYKYQRKAAGESIDSIKMTHRLFVEFQGLSAGYNYVFEVYCDLRQIALFQQFLQDYQLSLPDKKANKQGKQSPPKYSSGLFILRSAHLLWERQEFQDRHRQKNRSTQAVNEPWNTHQLYLHCALETDLLTAEGMSKIQQQKTQKVNNTLAKQLKNTAPTIQQQQSYRKNQTSQALLKLPLPRSSRPTYQGNPQIIVGLIFDPVKPIYLAVVNVITGKTITYRSTRQLLDDKYPNLSEYRLKQQQNNRQRQKQNQRGQFHQPTESPQGEYLDRLLAKAVIKVAREFKAASIVLPPVDRRIEKMQSQLEAYAEEEIPEDVGTQQQLTRDPAVALHKWSYNRLSGYIRSNAAQLDIAVEVGTFPSLGTPLQQATAIAIAAYNSRKHSQK